MLIGNDRSQGGGSQIALHIVTPNFGLHVDAVDEQKRLNAKKKKKSDRWKSLKYIVFQELMVLYTLVGECFRVRLRESQTAANLPLIEG